MYTQEEIEMSIAFNEGQERGLSFFYRAFMPALSLYAFRIIKDRFVAEEIASDAFVKIWKHHYKLKDFNSIRAYLYKTVRRDAVRKGNQRTLQTVFPGDVIEDNTAENKLDSIIRSEVYRRLYNAINELPPSVRKVMRLYYFDGLSSGEIAEQLRRHKSTIQTQKKIGLDALRDRLGKILFSYNKIVKLYVRLVALRIQNILFKVPQITH